jgi:hypothetical protein
MFELGSNTPATQATRLSKDKVLKPQNKAGTNRSAAHGCSSIQALLLSQNSQKPKRR